MRNSHFVLKVTQTTSSVVPNLLYMSCDVGMQEVAAV